VGRQRPHAAPERGQVPDRAGTRRPKTPSLQALWIDPITTIFCSEQWRPRKCDMGIRPAADRGLIAVLDEL
jgi:hypothetical protein